MNHHWKKPGEIWLLPIEAEGEPQRIEGYFNYHEDTGFEPDLEWLKTTLGCDMIEFRQLRLGHLWLDEEGKLKPSPQSRLNPVGTVLHQIAQQDRMRVADDVVYVPHDRGVTGEFIVGTALLVVAPEFPQETVEQLIDQAAGLWSYWRSATARVQA